jgi:hypothetical protein
LFSQVNNLLAGETMAKVLSHSKNKRTAKKNRAKFHQLKVQKKQIRRKNAKKNVNQAEAAMVKEINRKSTKAKSSSYFNLFKEVFIDIISKLGDPRKGKNSTYTLKNIIVAAFACFFYQCKSLNMFMKLKNSTKRNFLFFDHNKVPCDRQITGILDKIDYKSFYYIFYYHLDELVKYTKLKKYLVDDYLVIAYDGSQITSSSKLKSNKCTVKKHRDGSTTFHTYLLAVSIISEPKKKLSPLMLPPEFIQKQDGSKKQDCELNAAYRWLDIHGKNLLKYHNKVVLVGDSLFSCEPMCKKILDLHLNFVTRCKEGNNKTIYEFIKGIEGYVYKETVHIKSNIYEIRTYKYYEDVPIKNETYYSKKLNKSNSLKVNYIDVTIETKKRNSKGEFSFLTDKSGKNIKT